MPVLLYCSSPSARTRSAVSPVRRARLHVFYGRRNQRCAAFADDPVGVGGAGLLDSGVGRAPSGTAAPPSPALILCGRTFTMSWQAYVDTNLISTGSVTAAGIYDLQGNPWAYSAGFAVSAPPAPLPRAPLPPPLLLHRPSNPRSGWVNWRGVWAARGGAGGRGTSGVARRVRGRGCASSPSRPLFRSGPGC